MALVRDNLCENSGRKPERNKSEEHEWIELYKRNLTSVYKCKRCGVFKHENLENPPRVVYFYHTEEARLQEPECRKS